MSNVFEALQAGVLSMKRIALLGFAIESNRFAPVSGRSDFEEYGFATGEDMYELSFVKPWTDRDGDGFAGTMTKLREWEAVPVLFSMAGAGGPCDHGFFLEVVEQIQDGLRAAGKLDAVYIFAHGAGITTECDDLDGAYFEAVRDVVGPDVPIVATLDLHGNVSDRMFLNADVLIAFLTNPHIDAVERSAEAAEVIDRMFSGAWPRSAMIRLPLVTPQVCQLTAPGQPYGDLIRKGQEYIGDDIANVSILSGFAFSDTAYNGMAIVVTAWASLDAAKDVATELANSAWSNRWRYVPDLVDIESATHLAKQTDRPLVLADVADNPGGGGRGNTTHVLAALARADVSGVFLGIFFDPSAVQQSIDAGVGQIVRVALGESNNAFEANFTVQALRDGRFTPSRGMSKDVEVNIGPCCLLRHNEIYVVVSSYRRQIFDVDTFEYFGLDVADARVFVVKSRGHFRAGFEHLVPAKDILHVDVPGLATPNLAIVDWRSLPRPCFPLDTDTCWPNNDDGAATDLILR